MHLGRHKHSFLPISSQESNSYEILLQLVSLTHCYKLEMTHVSPLR